METLFREELQIQIWAKLLENSSQFWIHVNTESIDSFLTIWGTLHAS
jgi:hypothetical protein